MIKGLGNMKPKHNKEIEERLKKIPVIENPLFKNFKKWGIQKLTEREK